MSIVLSLKLAVKSKPVLRGHDHFWSIIMDRHRAGHAFTRRDIDRASNADLGTIRDFLRRLEAAGIIERVGTDTETGEISYRSQVVQSAAPRVRRDGSVIESQPATRCMWNLMRGPNGRAGFTYLDLVRWASTDDTAITVNTARSYIKTLHSAGYLVAITAGGPRKPTIWRLDPRMNTGPQAPMILRTKLIFDPNKQVVVGPAEAEEVQP